MCDKNADSFQQLQFIISFSKKSSLYCTLHNINDIERYQLNAFLVKVVCKNNPHVMLPVGNLSNLYTNIL